MCLYVNVSNCFFHFVDLCKSICQPLSFLNSCKHKFIKYMIIKKKNLAIVSRIFWRKWVFVIIISLKSICHYHFIFCARERHLCFSLAQIYGTSKLLACESCSVLYNLSLVLKISSCGIFNCLYRVF